ISRRLRLRQTTTTNSAHPPVRPFYFNQTASAKTGAIQLALQAALEQARREMRELQEQHDTLLKQSSVLLASKQCEISERAETTYLNIIGGMLTLMLSQSPSGVPYSSFKTQEALVSALVAHYGGTMGITERTLNGKFANAKRYVRSASA
ncbi:hypothetical protein ACSBRU_12050, partial [Pseudomonas aeruginosa]